MGHSSDADWGKYWLAFQLVRHSNWWQSERTSGVISPPVVTQHKVTDFFLLPERHEYPMMQLDCVSKLKPTASAHVSDIQLLQALWCCSQIFFLGRQHSHFHMKLSHHFSWQLTVAWCGFFFYTFLIFPQTGLAEPRGGPEEKFKQLLEPDEHFKLGKFGWRGFF